ncbi:hypothetical protein, partial [Mycoplasmopsis alligatoris]
ISVRKRFNSFKTLLEAIEKESNTPINQFIKKIDVDIFDEIYNQDTERDFFIEKLKKINFSNNEFKVELNYEKIKLNYSKNFITIETKIIEKLNNNNNKIINIKFPTQFRTDLSNILKEEILEIHTNIQKVLQSSNFSKKEDVDNNEKIIIQMYKNFFEKYNNFLYVENNEGLVFYEMFDLVNKKEMYITQENEIFSLSKKIYFVFEGEKVYLSDLLPNYKNLIKDDYSIEFYLTKDTFTSKLESDLNFGIKLKNKKKSINNLNNTTKLMIKNREHSKFKSSINLLSEFDKNKNDLTKAIKKKNDKSIKYFLNNHYSLVTEILDLNNFIVEINSFIEDDKLNSIINKIKTRKNNDKPLSIDEFKILSKHIFVFVDNKKISLENLLISNENYFKFELSFFHDTQTRPQEIISIKFSLNNVEKQINKILMKYTIK